MAAVQDELGAQATIAEIERAMLRRSTRTSGGPVALHYYQQLLSEVMQSLVDKQGTFPPKPEQSRVAKRRGCEESGPSSVG
jgi:hypothetical protein